MRVRTRLRGRDCRHNDMGKHERSDIAPGVVEGVRCPDCSLSQEASQVLPDFILLAIAIGIAIGIGIGIGIAIDPFVADWLAEYLPERSGTRPPQSGRHGRDSIKMVLLGLVFSTCAVGTPACSPACAPVRRTKQAGHADRRSADRADRESRDVSIAIDCGVEPVSGTWIDRMNADDA